MRLDSDLDALLAKLVEQTERGPQRAGAGGVAAAARVGRVRAAAAAGAAFRRGARLSHGRGRLPRRLLRVFVDTNVLVAAYATRGLCADLLRLILAQHGRRQPAGPGQARARAARQDRPAGSAHRGDSRDARGAPLRNGAGLALPHCAPRFRSMNRSSRRPSPQARRRSSPVTPTSSTPPLRRSCRSSVPALSGFSCAAAGRGVVQLSTSALAARLPARRARAVGGRLLRRRRFDGAGARAGQARAATWARGPPVSCRSRARPGLWCAGPRSGGDRGAARPAVHRGKLHTVPALARRREGTEAAARRVRYAALEAFRRRTGADRILTAHHRDDQIETLLLRLAAGSGLAGLSGIQRRRGALLRPLLDLDRATSDAFVAARGNRPTRRSHQSRSGDGAESHSPSAAASTPAAGAWAGLRPRRRGPLWRSEPGGYSTGVAKSCW